MCELRHAGPSSKCASQAVAPPTLEGCIEKAKLKDGEQPNLRHAINLPKEDTKQAAARLLRESIFLGIFQSRVFSVLWRSIEVNFDRASFLLTGSHTLI